MPHALISTRSLNGLSLSKHRIIDARGFYAGKSAPARDARTEMDSRVYSGVECVDNSHNENCNEITQVPTRQKNWILKFYSHRTWRFGSRDHGALGSPVSPFNLVCRFVLIKKTYFSPYPFLTRIFASDVSFKAPYIPLRQFSYFHGISTKILTEFFPLVKCTRILPIHNGEFWPNKPRQAKAINGLNLS